MILPSKACGSACSSLQAVARETFTGVLSSSAVRSRSPRHIPHCRSQLRITLQAHSRSFHSTPNHNSHSPRTSYRVAASSSGKSRPFLPARNAYNFNPEVQEALGVALDTQDPTVKRKRRPDSGEDAFFVSKIGRAGSTDNSVAFAVADGVGGWAESRVDPADFSHGLCGYMAETALDWDQPAEQLRAKALLQAGYDRVVADDSIRAGGCTASVGVGLEDGRIELANLGDSGSVLLRQAAVHHYSIPQTHGFNTPYQLSIIPPRMRQQASIFGGSYLEDYPRDAATTTLHMHHGDVLMLATDGVFDNLNNQDILKLVTNRMLYTGAWTASTSPNTGITPADPETLARLTGPEGLSSSIPPPHTKTSKKKPATASNPHDHTYTLQSLLAATIAGEAKLASMDLRRDSPFAKEAQRYYPGDYYRGGKVDDIAVVILVAVEV
ncbi:phosphatase 2C-like domain-containing protein [Aspergillus karnatakaensis]|uniref:type 2C protein phosphatase PTC7 n=1 Tax=Aspergillus karnatakaensis TaxID=1810916 RepID=UPI003CCDA53A